MLVLTKGIERIVDQIVQGTASAALTARLGDMEKEKATLESELAEMIEKDEPITLHPGAAEFYRRTVADLRSHLERMRTGQPAAAVLEQARRLIDRVEVYPPQDTKNRGAGAARAAF